MSGATTHRSPVRWMRHLASSRYDDLPLLGDRGAGRLLPVQALHNLGETMFAVSLVGSLFFSVSLDAARPRIVLYLAVTMAPFVGLAPLIGPLIDRVRGGHRMVLLAALGGRALLAPAPRYPAEGTAALPVGLRDAGAGQGVFRVAELAGSGSRD